MKLTGAHGGNVYQVARDLGCNPEDILDFSASINPLGPPPGLRDVLHRAFHRLVHYPDITNAPLLAALSDVHGLDPACIVVGNGSTELIFALPEALGVADVLAVFPTFSEYARAFTLKGLRVHGLMSKEESDFQPTVAQLRSVWQEVRPQAVLVTHPGSPSGSLLVGDVKRWLLEETRKQKIFLVVDEVFVDFCPEESFVRQLATHPRLVLIRSMTKFYAIPGLRLGYVLTSPQIARRIRQSLPPWSVNSLAQEAGIYCLKQWEYRGETLSVVDRERRWLLGEFSRIPGFHPLPGRANYLLVRMDPRRHPSATELRDRLAAEEGILIRDCSAFEGLGSHDFRIAVRLSEENQRLVEAFHRVMGLPSPQRRLLGTAGSPAEESS